MDVTPVTSTIRVTHADWIEIHAGLQERIHHLKKNVKESPTPDYWRPKLAMAETALRNLENQPRSI